MEEEKYISIGELTKIIKMKFDNSAFFNRVYIKGEISNFKRQVPSGHCYFTIKDEVSRISAVMFVGKASKLLFEPKDGDSVFVIGKISVYEPSGNYQIYVEEMNENGSGELYKKFLELKAELEKEGLFNIEHKRKIPRFPKRIGIVTASTGAAIRDIISTIKRRYPICETILFPSLVQGADAKDDIVKKIKMAQGYDLDVLIVGRGGGSIEDLWPFNERVVAYAIYESKIPVISAVGHEIDFTISDFVADLRAATPTAAAELAVPNKDDINQFIDSRINITNNLIYNKLNEYKSKITRLKESYILKNPVAMYEVKMNNLKTIIGNLYTNINLKINNKKNDLYILKNNYILRNPENLYSKTSQLLNKYIEKLELLNPLNSLKRGYSIVKKENVCIDSIKKIKLNDIIDVRVSDGSFCASVTNIKE